MNNGVPKKPVKRDVGAPEWIWEVLIVVTITPGLVYSLLLIESVPIV
jgi:hypothetical protein